MHFSFRRILSLNTLLTLETKLDRELSYEFSDGFFLAYITYLFAIQLVCALGEYLIYAIWIAECDKAKASAKERKRK